MREFLSNYKDLKKARMMLSLRVFFRFLNGCPISMTEKERKSPILRKAVCQPKVQDEVPKKSSQGTLDEEVAVGFFIFFA